MVTAADIRAVALSLPRAYEALVRDQVKFRVGRIVFVTISPDETTMGFGFPKAERAALVAAEPTKFFMPTRSDERYHWVQARLAALDQTELRELVTDAWCMCVPKSVAAAYFATTPSTPVVPSTPVMPPTVVTPPNPPAARRSPRRPDPR